MIFNVRWRGGRVEKIDGQTPLHAMRNAGHFNHEIYEEVDFMWPETIKDRIYVWVSKKRIWDFI